MRCPWFVLAVRAAATCLVAVVPVQAGPTELALLTSYIGEWSGTSALVGGAEPEPFSCRLTINKGNQSKINYAGRCTLASMNLSVTGTIAFDDTSRTYQAIMGSNAGYKGVAIGRVVGESIVFDLAEQEADRAGNAVRLGARITLIGSDSITVDYEVEFNDSNEILTAKVPFAR
jgi:hypothetical protein